MATVKKIFQKPESLTDVPFSYCPGCGHGIVQRLVAEAIDELGIREKTIAVWPVGCAVTSPDFFNLDSLVPAHGRAQAVATAIKRFRPENIVFAYQGDGDLAAIGTAETIHTANRGENITVIFINNTTYGMTGGQMAPTSLPGQKTTTTPLGRNSKTEGLPIQVCEMLAQLKNTAYIARVTVTNPKEIIKAKKAIKFAFQCQIEGRGYSLVEILSPCPVNWHCSPQEAMERITTQMVPCFPLGEFKKPVFSEPPGVKEENNA